MVQFHRTTGRHLATPAVRSAAVALALVEACAGARAGNPTSAERSPRTVISSFSEVLAPSAFFAQLGLADEATATTAGLTWNPGWQLLPSPWATYVEASISRWRSRGGHPTDRGLLTQLALLPVLRYRLDDGRSPWFAEGGVGVTVTSNLYRSGSTHFSTAFNFGSHVGAGYSLGPARQDEVSLRLEHFSNAGIKHPNPGENFVQLRYVRRFD